MRSIVQWAVKNSPAVNIVFLATLLGGGVCFTWLRREMFPEFELEMILVSMPYPGASPADVETGICQPIEESVRSMEGLKQIISIAKEGSGFVILELNSNVRDVQKLVADVRSRTDRITNFPDLAETPTVEQFVFRDTAIQLAILGPDVGTPESEVRLREVAERVRDELLQRPVISQAELRGGKNYQIDVEISQDTLRKHNLTLGEVAQIIKRHNAEMPGGQLRSESQEILLRGKNRREYGEGIKNLPLITQTGGAVLKVGDLGRVVDEFEDVPKLNRVNGRPALLINVDRTSEEDLIAICQEVHDYAAEAPMPAGFSLKVFGDTSIDVADRLRMLRSNGYMGLIIVFVLLALFLEFRLAFWVSMGIPISVFGAFIILYLTNQTLNMLSMFAFLMALGIVVDDAIVVGENIYSHRKLGKDFVRAAIDGTLEVLPSVIVAVMTTMIAFMPFFFVSGVMGKFIAVMPVAIIAMLAISLVESCSALPCHLSHVPSQHPKSFSDWFSYLLGRMFSPVVFLLHRGNLLCSSIMDWVGDRIYVPTLRFLLKYPFLAVAVSAFMLFGTVAMVKSGKVPFNAFPSSDSKMIFGQVIFSDGTPVSVTDRATRQMEEAIRKVSEQLYQEQLAKEGPEAVKPLLGENGSPNGPVYLTFRQVGTLRSQGAMGSGQDAGSKSGQVIVELHDTTIRDVESSQIINMWRKATGEIAGAERISFFGASVGPGGNPIEFRLLANSADSEKLFGAVQEAKQILSTFKGVYDIRDDAEAGKLEYQIKVKQQAESLGISTMDLAETIRHAYYGAEVMRLQRGRHEVKLMVRYPAGQRSDLSRFDEILHRTPDGTEIPITELADIEVTRGYSEINRLNQQRSITVTADLDTTEGNAQEIVNQLKSQYFPTLLGEKFPGVTVNWEGQQKQTMESISSLMIGSAAAMVFMFLLLVIEFRSYIQPFLIMSIIPFGFIGAIWGHGILGMEVTLFSFFGLVALTGVVVNDSIVLVDFINARVRSGVPYQQALLESGRRRMRPVFLTSVTTIGGLLPMLLETSFQAQFLKPMAASIAFGLMLSTVLVLFQVPVFFKIYLSMIGAFGFDPNETFEHDEPVVQPPDVGGTKELGPTVQPSMG